MQNSLRQQVSPSFETDKKWTEGRQNADRHPDQNLTWLEIKLRALSYELRDFHNENSLVARSKRLAAYRFATSSSRFVSAPTWKRWRRR